LAILLLSEANDPADEQSLQASVEFIFVIFDIQLVQPITKEKTQPIREVEIRIRSD
jgi:hypothetical protein